MSPHLIKVFFALRNLRLASELSSENLELTLLEHSGEKQRFRWFHNVRASGLTVYLLHVPPSPPHFNILLLESHVHRQTKN